MTPIRYRLDDEGKRRKVVLNEDHEGFMVRFTESCSGCFEFNEGWGLEHYGFDEKHKCYVGGGCHECGYTGKCRWSFWVPFDRAAWCRYMEESEAAEESRAVNEC